MLKLFFGNTSTIWARWVWISAIKQTTRPRGKHRFTFIFSQVWNENNFYVQVILSAGSRQVRLDDENKLIGRESVKNIENLLTE